MCWAASLLGHPGSPFRRQGREVVRVVIVGFAPDVRLCSHSLGEVSVRRSMAGCAPTNQFSSSPIRRVSRADPSSIPWDHKGHGRELGSGSRTPRPPDASDLGSSDSPLSLDLCGRFLGRRRHCTVGWRVEPLFSVPCYHQHRPLARGMLAHPMGARPFAHASMRFRWS